jgi:hypothetical protein
LVYSAKLCSPYDGCACANFGRLFITQTECTITSLVNYVCYDKQRSTQILHSIFLCFLPLFPVPFLPCFTPRHRSLELGDWSSGPIQPRIQPEVRGNVIPKSNGRWILHQLDAADNPPLLAIPTEVTDSRRRSTEKPRIPPKTRRPGEWVGRSMRKWSSPQALTRFEAPSLAWIIAWINLNVHQAKRFSVHSWTIKG